MRRVRPLVSGVSTEYSEAYEQPNDELQEDEDQGFVEHDAQPGPMSGLPQQQQQPQQSMPRVASTKSVAKSLGGSKPSARSLTSRSQPQPSHDEFMGDDDQVEMRSGTTVPSRVASERVIVRHNHDDDREEQEDQYSDTRSGRVSNGTSAARPAAQVNVS